MVKPLLFSLDPENKLSIDLFRKLNLHLSPIYISKFTDGEIYVRPLISVRNKKILLFKSLSGLVNDNLMQLLIAIDAFKRACASEIVLILPYYCYSRQDRQCEMNDPVSAKLVLNILQRAGASKVISVDLHSENIENYDDIFMENIFATNYIVENIRSRLPLENLVIVSPDYGGIKRAKRLGDVLGAEILIVEKRRPNSNESVSDFLFGTSRGKHCLIVDDILDTGGTIIGAAKLLRNKGALSVSIVVTHALFNGNALEKMNKAWEDKLIEKVYVSDTVCKDFHNYPFIEVVSIVDLLAEVISRECISCT